jgi:chromosome segregation ATPase
MRTPRPLLASLLIVAALFACASGDDVGDLDDRLANVEAAQASMQSRLDALDDDIADATTSVERIAAIESALDDLDRHITDLSDTVDEQLDAQEAQLAALGSAVDDLRGALQAVRDDAAALDARIADLGVRYEVLQARIDRLQQ